MKIVVAPRIKRLRMYVTDPAGEGGEGGGETNDNSDGSPDGVGAVTPCDYLRSCTNLYGGCFFAPCSLIPDKLVHYDPRDRCIDLRVGIKISRASQP